MTDFIAIVSGKGGVGKTVTAINLGVELSRLGKNIILVDASLSSPHIGLCLGKAKHDANIHDVLAERKNIEDAVYEHNSGMKIVPGNISIEEVKKLDVKKLGDKIKELKGKADIIILDSAAGLSDETREVLKSANNVIVVANPELHSVTDALRTIKLAEQHGSNVVGVVLSRVKNDEYELGVDGVESMLEQGVLAIIPEDNAVRHSLKVSKPVVLSHPNSGASLGYKMLASKLLGEKYEILNKPEMKKKPIFKALKKRFGL